MDRRLSSRWILLVCLFGLVGGALLNGQSLGNWRSQELSEIELDALSGLEGYFHGQIGDSFILAGGIQKQGANSSGWSENILLIDRSSSAKVVRKAGEFDLNLAFGASLSAEEGLVCVGGESLGGLSSQAMLLRWAGEGQELERISLPQLPQPLRNPSLSQVGDYLYVAGSFQEESLKIGLWRIADSVLGGESSGEDWESMVLPEIDPSVRWSLGSQFNGRVNCLYLHGVGEDGQASLYALDVESLQAGRSRNADGAGLPEYWMKTKGEVPSFQVREIVSIGQGHLYFIGHTFPVNAGTRTMQIWSYATVSDEWHLASELPIEGWYESFYSEHAFSVLETVDPSARVYEIAFERNQAAFGMVNYATVVLYLLALVAIGFYFARRNRNTDDFFRGGQRLPFWAAGLSIFATILSSITFVATPAKVYATNWTYLIFSITVPLVAPWVVVYVLPKFRQLGEASAYAYLEHRFNVGVRLFGSASFLLFQIGRMAIVLFLPSLALSAITGLQVTHCILVMGVLSILYCTAGGLEAVIWTDAVQTIVLMGGALVSIGVIIVQLDGGFGSLFSVGIEFDKFQLINWEWGKGSMAFDAFWVILLGSIGQNTISYASDQAVIQRYLSVSSEGKATKAIYTNALVMIPANVIFFLIGTALFVFYKRFPERLDPTLQTDGIFPFFIATELPVVVAGLVVAGIFAAAQSTVSTSMNSTATVFVSDFCQRFSLLNSERGYLRLSRIMTVVMGSLGVGIALLLATMDIRSLWDSFISLIGLFGGAMCGLFLLGMFTKKANASGALVGAVSSVLALVYVSQFTEVSGLIYGILGIAICFGVGYLVSSFAPQTKQPV